MDSEAAEGRGGVEVAMEEGELVEPAEVKPKFSPIRWDDPAAVGKRATEAASSLPAAYSGLASRTTVTDVGDMLKISEREESAQEEHNEADPVGEGKKNGTTSPDGQQDAPGGDGREAHGTGEESEDEEDDDKDISIRVDMLKGCRSVDCYERICRIDEGTYGVVYRAKEKTSGEIVALKKIKMEREKEGFPLTSIREINILLSFHHRSVVDVKEVVVGSSLDSVFMVMEYMEHDLKGLMERMKNPFSTAEAKCVMRQLLEGTAYLHSNWVLHRDLKTSNLLINNKGEVKICDFGLARQYGDPIKAYTHMVVTLWYR